MTDDLRHWMNAVAAGLLCEAVEFDDTLPPADRNTCEMALAAARHLLAAKGFSFLLDRLRFQDGAIHGEHGFYDPKADLAILDGSHYDAEDMVDAILHELGHRLYFRKGFLLRAKAFWKYFDPEVRRNVGPYGRQNHAEMFAELFRNFIKGRVDAEVVKWMESLS